MTEKELRQEAGKIADKIIFDAIKIHPEKNLFFDRVITSELITDIVKSETAKQYHAPKWITITTELKLNPKDIYTFIAYDSVRNIIYASETDFWSQIKYHIDCGSTYDYTHYQRMELPPINTEENGKM